jgi:hypothetical protein
MIACPLRTDHVSASRDVGLIEEVTVGPPRVDECKYGNASVGMTISLVSADLLHIKPGKRFLSIAL